MQEDDPVLAKSKADRRRYRRVRGDLPGQLFMPREKKEAPCKVVNLSPGGAGLECDVTLTKGMPVVLYIEGFGRFEGAVVREVDGGFAVEFASTALKRERTAEQLTLFMNRGLVSEDSIGRQERTQKKGVTHFTRADGQLVICEMIDLSLTGVSLKTDVKPPVGEFILIGQLAGRIARHHETGIGVEFVGGVDKSAPDKLPAKLTLPR